MTQGCWRPAGRGGHVQELRDVGEDGMDLSEAVTQVARLAGHTVFICSAGDWGPRTDLHTELHPSPWSKETGSPSVPVSSCLSLPQ